jgi:HK97 family phage major capsid protein
MSLHLPSLRESRAVKADQLRAIISKAASESRDLTSTEQSAFDTTKADIEKVEADIRTSEYLNDLERRMGGQPVSFAGEAGPRSWGERATESPELRAFIQGGGRGEIRIELRDVTALGSVVAPDRRPDIIALPQRRLVVRDLLPQATTTSSVVEYVRQATFTNSAATVAEAATKPASDMTFAVLSAPARVIAHVLTASRQALDDLPALKAFIDGGMLEGLRRTEELQLLAGNGTSPNLQGMIGVATAYETARNVGVADKRVDVLHHAIAQLADANLAATGIILNLADFSRMVDMKDSTGQYLSEGPFGTKAEARLWGIPVAATPALAAGTFLVGDFQSAVTLYDRLRPEVLISSEHSDYFAKNLLLIRCEERIALAIRMTAALITGSFGAIID